jgi:hypothetical protein
MFGGIIFSQNLDELLGKLHIEIEMPERPKESFFAGLFGVGTRNLDREELCKEEALIGAFLNIS